jgi:serine/threonine-protein kinase
MFGDQLALRRFRREAKASARLNHTNIISIYDYGAISAGNEEGAFLVMELLHGSTLRSEITRNGNISTEVTAELFNQLIEGIKTAHLEGVIHRDLKPENILIVEPKNGNLLVKILDFGLAKIKLTDALDLTSASLTTPGTIMGTFGYMSPEQIEGMEMDERSDLFSIGVMVVEALTGRRPFNGSTYNELLMSILNDTFHLPNGSKETQHLDKVLQKCLAKNPSERFTSAAKMQKDLIPAIRNCSSFAAFASTIHDISASTFKR